MVGLASAESRILDPLRPCAILLVSVRCPGDLTECPCAACAGRASLRFAPGATGLPVLLPLPCRQPQVDSRRMLAGSADSV